MKTLSIAITTLLCAAFMTLALAPQTAHAQYGLSETAGAAGLSKGGGLATITGKIVGAGLSLLGIVFLTLMVYGGFLWMTARGDDKTVKKAKDTITHAVIGFAIVAGAYAITEFAITAITRSTSGGGGGVSDYTACLAQCGNDEACKDRQCEPLLGPEIDDDGNVQVYTACLAQCGDDEACKDQQCEPLLGEETN